MTIVSVAFIISWFPNSIFFVIFTFSPQTGYVAVGYYPTMFSRFCTVHPSPLRTVVQR